MNFQEWINSRNGRAIDVDGWYGAQCWDSWHDYANALFGVPMRNTGCSAGGPGTHHPGYACEVYHQFDRSGLNQWFTRIGNVPAKAGDVAFWEWGSPVGPNSHVAVVIEDRGSHILCMTQNPGPNRIASLSKAGLLGYLRPDNQSPFGGGSGVPTNAQQRQAGSEPVNRRQGPTTQSALLQPQLGAGEVGNFNGWIHGENVGGNTIWFRGISGNWFWSGAFTSQSTAGLEDLNPKPAPTPPAMAGNQRQVGSEPVNRRQAPNTQSAILQPQLGAGEIGTFDAWINGESVSGNSVWFRGALSGNWFWSGAFTSQSTANLQDLNVKEPAKLKDNERVVAGSDTLNRRREPNTTSQKVDPPLEPGKTYTFTGWINGEIVDGNNIWLKAADGMWSWSGGFTSRAVTGLQDLNPTTPTPTPPPTPVVDPLERIVGTVETFRRPAPNRSVQADATLLQPGAKVKIEGWITGEFVSGIPVWYKLAGTDLYSWAGAFTSQSIDGVKDLNPSKPDGGADPVPVRKSVSVLIPDWNGSASGSPVFPRPVAKAETIYFPDTSIVEQNAQVSSNGYTIGRPVLPSTTGLGPINHFVLHHVAGSSLSGAISTLSGANGAPTANYVVKDRYLVSMVAEEDTPWTNGRWASNCHSITFEICNEGGDSSTGWLPPSGASMETVAWAMARATRRWGIEEPLAYGINVFGHKDVSKSATACPGGLDVAAVVKRANEILAKGPVPPTPPTPQPTDKDKVIAEALESVQEDLGTIIEVLNPKE